MAEDETLLALLQSADLMDEHSRKMMQAMEEAAQGCEDDRLRRVAQAMHASAKSMHRTAQEAKERCEKRC